LVEGGDLIERDQIRVWLGSGVVDDIRIVKQ
jgi:hypothetical protein